MTMKYQRILLIDDDEDDREIFENAVRRLQRALDYQAHDSAVTAYKALTSRDFVPDLIFLDLNMPVMNGQEFLKKIKGDSALKDIPVIIFSTSSNFKNISETMELGAHDYITKPYTFEELVKILEKII